MFQKITFKARPYYKTKKNVYLPVYYLSFTFSKRLKISQPSPRPQSKESLAKKQKLNTTGECDYEVALTDKQQVDMDNCLPVNN